jgi:phosphoglycerol transferase MdoB-like AlkP superfamily enzyme
MPRVPNLPAGPGDGKPSDAGPLVRTFDRIFPGRFAMVGVVLATCLAASLVTRLALLVFNGDTSLAAPWPLVPILAIGALYDLAAAVWFAAPFALLVALAPARGSGRVLGIVAFVLVLGLAAILAFTSAAELVFWNEFAVRFNFIAVDYLVYTQEVLGNIRESYRMGPLLGALALVTLLIAAAVARPILRAARAPGLRWRRRSALLAAYLALPGVAFVAVDARLKEFTEQAQAVQLAGNGPWEFFHAFRTNEIDYARFYQTVPLAEAYAELREEFLHAGREPAWTGNPAMPIEREIRPERPMKRLNVVMVSVESLSADFLGAFGNTKGLTPRLDALAQSGLLFTRVYATGTRTVRGLEALSLSIPPTPGHSVVKRPDNANLFTIGEVFREHGYESLYVYGGYGYFDNMNAFFGDNGYTVVDRTALPSADIHHENIWGVADEDLFTLALRELDRRHAAGTPFFAHVMTTSNHRPYTYPAGRIDIPSGTGRDGAVKYTDFAIGDFIARARDHAWFDDTLFVIVADHGASSRGRTELPIDRFHIPLIVYAPRHVAPGRVETVASQIDVPPTILALLDAPYRSRFFGQDILAEGRVHQRALVANYQTVGYLEDGVLVSLRPQRRARVEDVATGKELAPDDPRAEHYRHEAVGYYLAASDAFRRGALRVAQPGRAFTPPAPITGEAVSGTSPSSGTH